jgi:ABC-type uncharacterized transport system substrate-binding protein
MSPQYVSEVNGHDSNTSLAASMSNAPRLLSAVADSIAAKEVPSPHSSLNGANDLPAVKACKRCFGARRILRNAGTGSLGPCPVCK